MPSCQVLLQLLGRGRRSKAFRIFLADMNAEPVYKPAAHLVFYGFYEQGISLAFDRQLGAFDYAFLHVMPEGKYAGYFGDLPHGMQITDRRKDVRRKLGRPARALKRDNEISYLFDVAPYLMNFAFDSKNDEQIRLVCLMFRETNLHLLAPA
jgi:hypothetical protein